MIAFLIITALILLNGLFVAAEFALIGVSRAAMERRAAEGSRVASMLAKILRTPSRQDRYIATAQLGITFASLGLGMYGEHVLAEWLVHHLEAFGASRWIAAHTLATILAVLILTYFHIVVGEMVPKSLALQYSERTAMWIALPMHWIKLALFPLVITLNATGNGILRLMGVNRREASTYLHTPEELLYIVEESREGGLLQTEAGRVLRDLFEFGELSASEVMVPRVHIYGIPLDAPSEAIRDIVRESRHTRYPVFERDLDHIVGMIHITEVFRVLLENKSLTKDLIRPLPFVPETTKLDKVLESMRRTHTRMAVVMDEHGGTAGIMTVEDLFSEVIGDVETGASHLPDVYRDDQGRLHVAGTVRLDELEEHVGRSLEHEDVDTISGVVLMLLERPPVVGDAVEYNDLRLEVVAVENHGVEECIVHIPE